MRTHVWLTLGIVNACAQPVPEAPPPEPPGDEPDPTDPTCQIQSQEERAPGWPYSLPLFRDGILPLIKDDCALCHSPPRQSEQFTVWTDAAPGNCSYAKSFNSLAFHLDPSNPTNSRAWVAVSGGNPTHPFRYRPADENGARLLAFIENAQRTLEAGTGGPAPPPPPSASPYDYAEYEALIQPIIDGAGGTGCSNAACHGAAGGLGGFFVHARPGPGSTEMRENFDTITAISDLQDPGSSRFYLQATQRHAGGNSVVATPRRGRRHPELDHAGGRRRWRRPADQSESQLCSSRELQPLGLC